MADVLAPVHEGRVVELDAALWSYQEALGESDEAVQYLLGRGLSPETCERFRLGLVGEDFLPAHGRQRGRLVIPYLGVDGRPVTVRFRCLGGHSCKELGHGKYASLPGDASRTFNVRAVAADPAVLHVCEGEFDAMVLSQLGGAAVALPGVSSLAARHARMFGGFDRVWVWGDPDEAGEDFGRRVCGMVPQARQVGLRLGDVSETFAQVGGQGVRSLVPEGAWL